MSTLKKAKMCSGAFVLALNDTLNAISGKWKLPIIGALTYGRKRFGELQREIPGITPRMLSKELKDLEANGMVRRTVYDTIPVSVIYELTASGKSFGKVLDVMVEWGQHHRRTVIRGEEKLFAA